MQALKVVISILFIAALLGASYLCLNDLADPFYRNKGASVFLWFCFFVPTVVMVHFTWFHGKGPVR